MLQLYCYYYISHSQ